MRTSFSVRYILRFDGRRESVCTYVRANPSHNYVCVIYRIADIYNIFFYCRFIYEMNKWSCPITINCICAKIVLSIANVGELDAISLVWRIIRIATYQFRLRLLSIIIRTHFNRGREMVISTQAVYLRAHLAVGIKVIIAVKNLNIYRNTRFHLLFWRFPLITN